MKWATDAKIAGLMARVGSRLINSATEKYVKQIIHLSSRSSLNENGHVQPVPHTSEAG